MTRHLLACGLALALALAAVAAPTRAEETETKYKPGKGFTWQSTDGRFKLHVGGRIQARYTYEDYDSELDKDDLSEFTLPRVRVELAGHIFDDFEYKFQSDWGKGDEKLKDALINWAKYDQAQIQAGQFKIHFDLSEYISSGKLEFVDRSLAAEELGYGRDVGVQLHGEAAEGKFEYGVGVYDGEGENGRNKNDGMLYAVHFGFNPNGPFGYSEGNLSREDKALWTIGVSAFWNEKLMEDVDGDGKANDLVNDNRYVASFGFRKDRVYLQGEYYWDRMSIDSDSAAQWFPTGMDEIDADAWYFQVGVMLAEDAWEMAVRYSEYDPNDDISDDSQAEATLAVSRYLWNVGHSLKVQGDLSWLQEEDGPHDTLEDWRFRLQAQIVF